MFVEEKVGFYASHAHIKVTLFAAVSVNFGDSCIGLIKVIHARKTLSLVTLYTITLPTVVVIRRVPGKLVVVRTYNDCLLRLDTFQDLVILCQFLVRYGELLLLKLFGQLLHFFIKAHLHQKVLSGVTYTLQLMVDFLHFLEDLCFLLLHQFFVSDFLLFAFWREKVAKPFRTGHLFPGLVLHGL